MSTVLVLLAHGTADADGQATVEQLRAAVAQRLHDRGCSVVVRLAFADVITPTAEEVLAGTSGAVVVPIFLTSGYHVQVDAPAAAASAAGVTLTPALGADPGVMAAVARQVRSLAGLAADRVILTAAGSSRFEARAEVEQAGRLLAEHLELPVDVAFLTGPGARLHDLVTPLSGDRLGRRIVVASYLLAPGFFARKAHQQAAELGLRCTDPIGSASEVVDLIVSRFADTLAGSRALRQHRNGDRRTG